MNTTATVIVLNGVGSAGKSTIAKALQTMTDDPFLHVQMDTFIEMLPEAYQDHPDGIAYETAYQDGKPLIAIKTGKVGEHVMRGMRHAIAAMAEQGNNLIVDDVMIGNEGAAYADLLAPFQVFLVGVFAPLEVLEARERQRGDRTIGLARWQYDRVHVGMTYDLEIDTNKATPTTCAKQIKQAFRL